MKSKIQGRMTANREDDAYSKKSTTRFSKAAIKILKTWMDDHRDHPYPTDSEKLDLQGRTGLTGNQVSNWMANTRRREKNKIPRGATSPSLRPSRAINIPDGRTWESMDPFERWQHSPPENEPAPLNAIVDAVENSELPEHYDSPVSTHRQQDNVSSSGFSRKQTRSNTSWEGRSTSAISSGSFGTAWSHGSSGSMRSFGSFGSFNSFGSGVKKDRRRRRRPIAKITRTDNPEANRPFQCTFCTDRFKSKYDWSRHEKSLHISLERWICAPIGKVITSTASGQTMCVFCDEVDPSEEHFESHNIPACEMKGRDARTFFRKDHLRQHLRLMHNGCKLIDSMESWKSECVYIRSRCGFCGEQFTKWQDRIDHLAKEFRNGAKMRDWKGCRGLDPDVAAQVTNAMPPFLIDHESKSPLPFSATNHSSMRNSFFGGTGCDSIGSMANVFAAGEMSLGGTQKPPLEDENTSSNPNATCWEVLTVNLGHYARQKLLEGVVVTDEMLQAQARMLLYDNDDPWNQTAADNPQWLELFKKAHGVGYNTENFDLQDALDQLGVTSPNARQRAMATLDPSPRPNGSIGEPSSAQYTGMSSLPALSTPASLSEPPSASTEAFQLPLPDMTDMFDNIRHIDCPVGDLSSFEFPISTGAGNIQHVDCPVSELDALNFYSNVDLGSILHGDCPVGDLASLDFSNPMAVSRQQYKSPVREFSPNLSTENMQHVDCPVGEPAALHFSDQMVFKTMSPSPMPSFRTSGPTPNPFDSNITTFAEDGKLSSADPTDEFLDFPFEMTM